MARTQSEREADILKLIGEITEFVRSKTSNRIDALTAIEGARLVMVWDAEVEPPPELTQA